MPTDLQTRNKKGRPRGRPSCAQLAGLEIKSQGELCDTMATIVTPRCSRRAEITVPKIRTACVAGSRIQEVRVIEKVEEIGLERKAGILRDLEPLRDVEVDVRTRWTVNAVAADWHVAPQAIVHARGAGEVGERVCVRVESPL